MTRRMAIVSLHRGGMMHAAAGLAASVLAADPNAAIACFCPRDADVGVLDSRVKVFCYAVPQVLRMRTVPGLLALPRVAARLRRDILRWRPDIVHFNSGHLLLPFMVRQLAWQLPVVATIHDVTPHPGERYPLDSWKTRALLAVSRRVIVHGETLREQALRRWNLPPDRVVVQPLEMAFPLEEATAPLPTERRTLLLFGRIFAYKGYEVFAQALTHIAAAVPEVRVVVAGTGNRACLDALMARHGDRICLIHRFIRDDELADLFRSASVVVLPYIEASQSGVVLLAAAYGRPVVASRAGAIPSVVEDGVTGRLVTPECADELAAAVKDLLADPVRAAAMGEAARQRVVDPARRQASGQQMLAIYAAAGGP